MGNEETLSSPERWVEAFAQELGESAPSDEQFNEVLKLAGIAAHASARQAAPVACWIAGRVGIPLSEAIAVAERLAAAPAGE